MSDADCRLDGSIPVDRDEDPFLRVFNQFFFVVRNVFAVGDILWAYFFSVFKSKYTPWP